MNRNQVLLLAFVTGLGVSFLVPFVARYTEIDWIAYMQEVEGPVVHNNFDYITLAGQTGPLVYPAGFVYLFALFRFLTQNGSNIFHAQLIFSLIHSGLMAIVLFSVYTLDSTPQFAIPLVVLSRRAHSIFELRLFNDGVAMLFAYASIALAMKNRWTLASTFFSLAVSVKMNCLLFAPGFAVLLVRAIGMKGMILNVAWCAFIQLVLALPFLAVNPYGYLTRSFDLGRVFLWEWTVNFKFLDEEQFQSKSLSLLLLGCTLVVWLLFGHFRWSPRGGLFQLLLKGKWTQHRRLIKGEDVATVMLESNLIGIVFARSLHYQFYAWYVHALPFLVFRGHMGRFPWFVGVGVILAIEVCFNIFPATPLSSFVLQLCHIVLLISAWFSKRPISQVEEEKMEAKVM